MKKNEITDLKTKTMDELKRMLSDFREEIDQNKKDASLGKVKNSNFVKNKKKDIARVLTFLSMKTIVGSLEKEVKGAVQEAVK